MNQTSNVSAQDAAIAEEVRRFYQRHPYPAPVETLTRYQQRWSDKIRKRADFHLFEPGKPYRDNRSILVAGCGTSQAAKYAVRWPNAPVTGIDVSSTSLEKTWALKRKFKLDNLKIVELPLERATELSNRFEHIVCTGVLHHLPDPAKGLKALHEVLDPGGTMNLMVYAPYGRAGIYLIQEYCRRLGISPSSEEIHDLAETLSVLPRNHPLAPLFQTALDFKDEASIADALMHPQDRPYTVEQFFDFLDEAGLQFERWIRQAEYSPRCGILRNTPHSQLLQRLSPRKAYAAVELFRGNMLRHSAVVSRQDRKAAHRQIDFAKPGWESAIPIRLPDVVKVQERLPEGAAAVLINPAHTQTDIYLPVNQLQLNLFDSIDNKSTFKDIAAKFASTKAARDFFEVLWQQDLIVVDCSPREPAMPIEFGTEPATTH